MRYSRLIFVGNFRRQGTRFKSCEIGWGCFLLLGFDGDRDFAFFLCELRSGIEGKKMYVMAASG